MKRNKNINEAEDVGFFIAMTVFSIVVGMAIIAVVSKVVIKIATLQYIYIKPVDEIKEIIIRSIK